MSDGTGVLAIIPVRGGSVGIPRKNARLLRGKPDSHHARHQRVDPLA